MRAIRIEPKDFHHMVDQCRKAYPREACGLLLGKEDRVHLVWPLRNVSPRPDRFWADADQQLSAFSFMEESSLELTAIYHSHPDGRARPSKVDLERAYWPEALMVIIAGPPWPDDSSSGKVGVFDIKGECVLTASLLLDG